MTELVDAQFYAPLKTSLVLSKGSGNPSFSRNTSATMLDNENKLITVPSNCVRFEKARFVRNIITYSENVGNITKGYRVYNLTSDDTSTDYLSPTGTSPVSKLSGSGSGQSSFDCYPSDYNDDNKESRTFSLYIKIASGASSIKLFQAPDNGVSTTIDLNTLSVSNSGGAQGFIISDGNGWYRISCIALKRSFGFWTITINPSSTFSGVIYAFGSQIENTTGQLDKAPSEYVSTGILSAPYHGAGVDGCKFFSTNKDGSAISDSSLLGCHLNAASRTNNLLWCRDLTNAVWVKTNITAAKTQTGIDAVTNSCSLLTASAENATVLQTITAASTPASSGFYVKRSVGSGSIFFTRNGGVDWLDITSLINSSTFTCVKIENTSVTNPQVGFKIATSGDAIIVDAGINHAGTTLTLPILTTSAAVTRAADVLTYQTSSNFSDTAGTILATYKPTYDTYAGGSIVGSATSGLYASTSNSGVQALDGTNTINGPTGTPSGQIRIGARWSGSSLQCFALDSFGSSGNYDGSFNLSTIGILPGTAGYIRDLAIWTSSLTDIDIRDSWNLITAYITSGSLVGMQSILSSSTSSISTVIYGSITATYIQPTLTATYTVPTIEAEI